MSFLLDVNVLLAVAWPNHPHHVAAQRWLQGLKRATWATCATTELGFVRLSAHPAFTATPQSPAASLALLDLLAAHGKYEQWAEPKGGLRSTTARRFLGGAVGHAQVTDAFLVAVAVLHRGRLATFDRGVHALFPAHVEKLV